MRKTYGLSTIAIHRGGITLGEEQDIRQVPFQAGDTLVVHTQWESLARLEQNPDFVIVTTESCARTKSDKHSCSLLLPCVWCCSPTLNSLSPS